MAFPQGTCPGGFGMEPLLLPLGSPLGLGLLEVPMWALAWGWALPESPGGSVSVSGAGEVTTAGIYGSDKTAFDNRLSSRQLLCSKREYFPPVGSINN